jgi:4'-phosphopantetheinyl transferase
VENERAARFHFQKDRERFMIARGALRVILGRYLNMEPSQVQFSYGPHGKPALAGECAVDALCFNASHSHELVLCAVTRGSNIGVDVEHVRTGMDAEEIAERFFSSQEIATLRSLPPERKQEAFFACWTRKEAYIKARGDGLGIPLDSFSVSFSPGEPAALLGVQGHPEETSRWSLWELNPDPSYAAALAVEGRKRRLRFWQFADHPA